MPVRAPLIVKNSQEKVDGKKAHAAPESSDSPSPLLTRSFRLDIPVFSPPSRGSHCA